MNSLKYLLRLFLFFFCLIMFVLCIMPEDITTQDGDITNTVSTLKENITRTLIYLFQAFIDSFGT